MGPLRVLNLLEGTARHMASPSVEIYDDSSDYDEYVTTTLM